MENHGYRNAKNTMDFIKTLWAITQDFENDIETVENAEQAAMERALSVEVRGEWQGLDDPFYPEFFRIMLTAGGPHLHIEGRTDLAEFSVIYSDWDNGFTVFYEDGLDDVLSWFCGLFYFGDI